MAKIAYKTLRMQGRSLRVVEKANEFIESYLAQGLQLTLRQLYYRFVAANLIPNKLQAYKKLGHTLSEARLAGLVDWDAIIDRGRGATRHEQFAGPADALDNLFERYRRDRWADQPTYVEVWCEKDAIAGVLEPLTEEFHVPLMSNRGYSSQTAMRDSANRFLAAQWDFKKGEPNGKRAVILYIGDHDPSGEDMTRDIEERFLMFGCPVEFIKLTLTIEQVRKFKLPPNPAKTSDSRFKEYRRKFGIHCWETDALEPKFLQDTLKAALTALVHKKKMAKVIKREKADVRKLRKVNARILKGLKRERGEE